MRYINISIIFSTKCKGVMGAVMAIKHLAGKTESCDKAIKLFSMCLLFCLSQILV